MPRATAKITRVAYSPRGPFPFERALFIVGEPNAGKSVQLRSMFRGVRLGSGGNIPLKGNLSEMYRLSNERILYLRLSSPHESNETLKPKDPDNYLDKTLGKFLKEGAKARRWNFANALQPSPEKRMPDVLDTVSGFVNRFRPERTRIAFLSPDHNGFPLHLGQLDAAEALRKIDSVEVCWIDARDREANGLMLADFFDFT